MLIVVVIYISRLMRTEKLELGWSIGTGFRIGLRYAKLKSIENQVRPPVSKNTNGFFTNLVNERRAGRYMLQLNSER